MTLDSSSDIRFHHVHGKNARIANNGLTALRPRPLAEFNDAIVFSNRPLRDGELFEILLDSIVDRWSGSIELGRIIFDIIFSNRSKCSSNLQVLLRFALTI